MMSDSDLTERLAEALAVCDAATEGPWEWRGGGWSNDLVHRVFLGNQSSDDVIERGEVHPHNILKAGDWPPTEADATFIAAARTGYPAALKALQAVLDTVESYPVPSKYDDPTGDIGGAVEVFGCAVKQAVAEHLDATP